MFSATFILFIFPYRPASPRRISSGLRLAIIGVKVLTKKILRLARRRDRTPPGPDNTFIDEPGMKAAIERANAAMGEKDWGRATTLWHEVLDQFGDRAPREAHLSLSRALRRDGQFPAAQVVLLEQLNRDPEDLRLRRELAAVVEAEEKRPYLRQLPLVRVPAARHEQSGLGGSRKAVGERSGLSRHRNAADGQWPRWGPVPTRTISRSG